MPDCAMQTGHFRQLDHVGIRLKRVCARESSGKRHDEACADCSCFSSRPMGFRVALISDPRCSRHSLIAGSSPGTPRGVWNPRATPGMLLLLRACFGGRRYIYNEIGGNSGV